ncbi:MAG: hypothetical protein M1830_009155 [Pleopsidium flavum]|nr:MAG: hypothetical protein M1830_009155 [Pleopsidium flavum]
MDSTTSQKPADELYATFKQTFPEVGPGTASSTLAPPASTASLSDALTGTTMNHRQFLDHDDLKDQDVDPTPRGSIEPWRFTPSLLDPNSFAFASFANQPPGYYTPTPGGTNTLYNSQAGDLHTPSMGIHIATPLSLPTSEGSLHAGSTVEMDAFHQQMLQPHHFQNPNPFGAQQSYAPSSFVHQDSGYEAMEASVDGSPMGDVCMETDIHGEPHGMSLAASKYDGSMVAPQLQSLGKFRYHVTLNAPTAMIRHADEIPVTYLNKGQAYSMTIVDTASPAPTAGTVKYRTFVRISFEDEQQRQRPAACWQLWKEGRGTNEAHQRGGKLQAVEYVDPNQGGDEETKKPRIELETASFDGFSVTWTPNVSTGTADCSVAVRFNFLSTDFSHSKGVKGIPVRLCAKTEIISSSSPDSPKVSSPEVCFCKVKLFRDHGAERKLSNDVAHVKKTIDKLKQQIAQAETGMKDFGKRKRSGSMATKSSGNSRPGKVQKHKRTWSMSSQSSTGCRAPAEEDLHFKLGTMQDMFTSTRPVSVLYLKGYDQDDPDVFPVHLTGEPQDLTKIESISRQPSWDHKESVGTTPTNSCVVSPTSSSNSLHSRPRSNELHRSSFQQSVPFDPSPQGSNDWNDFSHMATVDLQTSNPQHLASPPDQPVRVQTSHLENSGSLTGWIEALGVDSSYRPPPDRSIKPVACFYVLVKVAGKTEEDDYYRAVYLMQRTVNDLIHSIAAKCNVEPSRVTRTFRVNPKGLKILVDDEVVRELPEGQDMTVEFSEIKSDTLPKREWDAGATDLQVDGDISVVLDATSSSLEMKLSF